MRAPAALLALPLIAAAATGAIVEGAVPQSFPLLSAIGALFALAAATCYTGEGSAPESAVSIAIAACFAGLSLGAADARHAYHPTLAQWFEGLTATEREQPVEISGVLREDAALTAAGVSLAVAVESVRRLDQPAPLRLAGGVRLAVAGAPDPRRIAGWRAGRRVVFPALLRLPSTYRNPGLPDERRSLARRGIVLAGTVKSGALLDVRSRGGALREAAGAARAWARATLARHVGRWGGPSGGITTAILIGDRTGLSQEDELRLQRAGTYHVIAISGGNIAILAALLLAAARLIGLPPRAGAAAAIAVLLFYGTLTGAPASVSRAVTAAVIYLGARILDHRGPPLNALAVGATGAIAVSALAPLDAGFLLSFGATLGILLGGGRLLAHPAADRRWRRLLHPPLVLLAATVCAEIALAPAGAILFGRVTFAGLLLNFAAIPLMTIVQAGAIVTLAAAPAWTGAAALAGLVTHLAATALVRSAALVELMPWVVHDVAAPAWWLVSLYYLACAVALWCPRHARRALLVLAVCLALIAGGPRLTSRRELAGPRRGFLRVVFLDVGQGDATLALLPGRRPMLVDAGPATAGGFDAGSRVVSPSLRALGVRGLESLVVTHADPDHAGGAASIFRAFAPRALWEGVPVPPEPTMRELARLSDEGGARWRSVQAGDSERDRRVTIRVLNPPPPDWERQRVRNDDSVALELRIGEVSIVLPGDMERAAEEAALPHLAALAPLVILKAAHHGSATSSTVPFLDAVRPAAVIFSAGRDNRYGHPHPQVVRRYVERGAICFTTAVDGAVILDTDGHEVRLWGWASGRGVVMEVSRRQRR